MVCADAVVAIRHTLASAHETIFMGNPSLFGSPRSRISRLADRSLAVNPT
jgi:hypothetical protein